MDLAALTTIWATLRDKLAQESGLDDDELHDTLDGELDLADRLRSLTRKRRHLLADADALKQMIKEMCERKSRLEKTADTIGNAIVHAMSAAGIKKLSAPDFSVSLGYGKPPLAGADSLDVYAMRQLGFTRHTEEIDRPALRKALEAGEQIPGVYLGNPQPHLIVRKS